MAQPELDCFAITLPGAEEVCARELVALGLEVQVAPGGVSFKAVARDLYRVNLWSRVASRVLVRLAQFRCRDFPELYRQLLKQPWGRYIRPGRHCLVRVSCRTSRLNHSGRISETVLAALEKNLGSSEQAVLAGEQLIFIRLENDQCTVSLDSSGELLHRRGYRQAMVAAPLRENLAATILLKLGYDGSQALVDAMAGSGTFAIEAALIAAGLAPGRQRRFAFMDWPHYRPHVWTLCLQESAKTQVQLAPLVANDHNQEAVEAIQRNAAAAGVAELVRVEQGPMPQLQAPADEGLLICNPPYGGRLGAVERLMPLYSDFGKLCRGPFRHWSIGWIAAQRRFVREVQLDCQRHWSFSNGGIKVELRFAPRRRG